MKKSKIPNKIEGVPIQNPVAKFAHQFNKAHVFADKNNYRRNAKHRKQEASPMALVRVIGEASCILGITLKLSASALSVIKLTIITLLHYCSLSVWGFFYQS